jgi:transposase-like protein
MELEAFAASDLGRHYPAMVQAREGGLGPVHPVLEFSSAVRKITYTTNAIES